MNDVQQRIQYNLCIYWWVFDQFVNDLFDNVANLDQWLIKLPVEHLIKC